MLKLTRYLKDQLLSMAYHELPAQEYRDQETDAIQHVISSGRPMEYEKKIIRRDGCRVPILLGAFIVQAGDEMPSGLAMILKDVTEKKLAKRDIIEPAYLRHCSMTTGMFSGHLGCETTTRLTSTQEKNQEGPFVHRWTIAAAWIVTALSGGSLY
jgi:PAS domain S-box-containing protein